MKNKGGRPTKYVPGLINKIDEYLSEAVPENMKIPTVEGLCLKLGISRETFYAWGKKYPEFSDTIKLIKLKQKEHLTEIGIFGGKEINASIVALLLKVNHDMNDSKIDINVDNRRIQIIQLPQRGDNMETIPETVRSTK